MGKTFWELQNGGDGGVMKLHSEVWQYSREKDLHGVSEAW